MEVFSCLEDVQDAEGGFLDEEDDELDAVPDDVEGGDVGVRCC